MNVLKGYVTYLAAAGMLALAVVDFVNGNTDAGMQKLAEAFGLAGLRRAVGG